MMRENSLLRHSALNLSLRSARVVCFSRRPRRARANKKIPYYRERKTMKFLLDEKFSRLAEKNGWTTDRAQGYVEGETARRSGKKPATWAVVGIDEYSLGFRAGYFE